MLAGVLHENEEDGGTQDVDEEADDEGGSGTHGDAVGCDGGVDEGAFGGFACGIVVGIVRPLWVGVDGVFGGVLFEDGGDFRLVLEGGGLMPAEESPGGHSPDENDDGGDEDGDD